VVTQGTSKSMPWLADLVESNDSSLDVLPVQCLCEFLLHDVPSDVSSPATGEDSSQVDWHKKQVFHGLLTLVKILCGTHCSLMLVLSQLAQ